MSRNDLASNLELMFSPVCPVPRAGESTRVIEHRVSGEIFTRLLAHWANMPVNSRPRLRGLSVTRDSARALIVLLDVGARVPFLNLLVDGETFPSMRYVWPYGAWWEDELRGFENVALPEAANDLGVEWRRA
jgi:hypothetical protein